MKKDSFISLAEDEVLKALLGEHLISTNNRDFIKTLAHELAPFYFESAFKKGAREPTAEKLTAKQIEFAKKVSFVFVFKPQIQLYCVCTLNREIQIEQDLLDNMKKTLETSLSLDPNQVLTGYLNLLIDCSDLSRLEDGLRVLLIQQKDLKDQEIKQKDNHQRLDLCFLFVLDLAILLMTEAQTFMVQKEAENQIV